MAYDLFHCNLDKKCEIKQLPWPQYSETQPILDYQ